MSSKTIAPLKPTKRKSPSSRELVTGKALLEMGDIGRTELVAGRIIHLMPTGRPHSRIEVIIAALLFAFNQQQKLGEVLGGETGIYTSRNPDTVRGMDVAFISNERLQRAEEDGFLTVAPELIAEIISPSDRWTEIQTKLAEYFAIDVKIVWLVDPKLEQVYVYHSIDDVTRFTKGEELSGEDILPGFTLAVAEIFG